MDKEIIDNLRSLCPACLRPLAAGHSVCARCGFDPALHTPIAGALPSGRLLHRRYRIVLPVKRGGFSIVYSALDLKSGTTLAIKEYFPDPIAQRSPKTLRVVPTRLDLEEYEQGLDEFLDEARLMERLNNYPGTVSLLDFFHENGSAYIAMPLLHGHDIAEELGINGALSFHKALRMLLPAMEALQIMHERGYVHADISPSNIFLEDSGRVRLIDLGSMRRMGKPGQALHIKTGYTPPELYLTDLPIEPTADVYSMAATLYRMITMVLPQDARDRLTLDALLPPSEMDVKIPRKAEVGLLRGLALSPDRRFEDMADFMDALLPPSASER